MESELVSLIIGLPALLYLLLLTTTLVQLGYYLFIYRELFSYSRKEPEHPAAQPVSVIIAARNEGENLKKFLPAILEQDYPAYEVVVVNDRSWDNTAAVLREMKLRYSRLKVVDISENEKHRHGKKFAVTMGIKAAGNELLLFTDADCRPLSGNWIRRMQEAYGENTEIVLGISPYIKERGLLNAFIRYEAFYTALNYLSFALAGRPYMGVGRNLSYKKSLFFNNKGFANHMHLKSGDDDLFVNKAANKGNTRIAISDDARTMSEAEKTWADYIRQKRRHQSVGKYYKASHKFHLSLIAGSSCLFYLCLIILCILGWDIGWLATVAGLKWLIQYIIFRPGMRKMNAGDLWAFLPFFDMIYHIYILVINLVPAPAEKVQWK